MYSGVSKSGRPNSKVNDRLSCALHCQRLFVYFTDSRRNQFIHSFANNLSIIKSPFSFCIYSQILIGPHLLTLFQEYFIFPGSRPEFRFLFSSPYAAFVSVSAPVPSVCIMPSLRATTMVVTTSPVTLKVVFAISISRKIPAIRPTNSSGSPMFVKKNRGHDDRASRNTGQP